MAADTLNSFPLESLSNIGESLALVAARHPDQRAVCEPATRSRSAPLVYRSITFSELELRSRRIAAGWTRMGVPPGTRISLLVPPGIDFVAWVFGLLRAGAVVVLIDPGMDRKHLVDCLAEAELEGMVGIRRAHIARWIFHKRFPKCRLNFLPGGAWLPFVRSSREFFQSAPSNWKSPTRSAEEPAAVIFTTGSTGPPKGVLYRHRNFIEQNIQIRDYFGIEPGGVDVSGFPLFALFNAGMGVTTVFPAMDARRPAAIEPTLFRDAVDQFAANQSFGSPALWNTVSRWGEQQQVRLPTIGRVLTAGAPVPPHLLERIRKMIANDGKVHTPYGATEALPVACIESREVLTETRFASASGAGTCVGRPWPKIEWRVIEISDTPIGQIEDAEILPQGIIGELIVRGPAVTDEYVTRRQANADHKIHDAGGTWHRMGDVGYLDDQNRFWFCGRKSHRVVTALQTLFTIPCEAIFNNHVAIYRSALVGIGPRGQQTPAIVVEPWPEHWPKSKLARQKLLEEVRQLAKTHPMTSDIERFYLKRKLPVDIRHNAKIFREQLAEWAAAQPR